MSPRAWLVVGAVAVVAAIAVVVGVVLTIQRRDEAASEAAPSSSLADAGPPVDPRGVAAEGDAALLADLCAEFCEQLIAQENACPAFEATSLLECSMPLARGIDLVNDMADSTVGLDRSDPERYEALDAAIVTARDAYDEWSDGPSPEARCPSLGDINDPFWWRVSGSSEEVGKLNMQTCSLRGDAAGARQASVGAVLRNLVRAS